MNSESATRASSMNSESATRASSIRVIIVGLGIQGHKRKTIAHGECIATVDPFKPEADYKNIKDVPLEIYDAALLCIPDGPKVEMIDYLLTHQKHVLVEKPLLDENGETRIEALQKLARKNKTTLYTAYNHRFEPHFVNAKKIIDSGQLGKIYNVRMFYGNGTARDVKLSEWRDQGAGVLPDLGSHLLDTLLFLFPEVKERDFNPWSFSKFENQAYDHVIFGSKGVPQFELEATLLSWRNTFRFDVFAEKGSLHIDCLCKWGPSKLTLRTRVLPSGRPEEVNEVLEMKDPTWALEYDYFKALCIKGEGNTENDVWVNRHLRLLSQ